MKTLSGFWLTPGVIAASFALVGFAQVQVCAPQPSSWWPGDGNAADLVAGNNGTIVGGVTFAPGKVGKAFSFNGSGYVSFGITPSIVGTGPLTIELWLKTAGNGFIITQRDNSFVNGEYLLSVGGPPNGFGFTLSPSHLCWSEYGDNVFGFNFCSVSAVTDNVFHHIAVTREVDGTGKIYIDGVLDSSQASPPRTLIPLNVYMGEDVRDAQAPLTGLIDELTIYKTALSQQAIRAIFQAGSVGKCKVGCVGQSLVPTTVAPTQGGNAGSATVTVTGCGLSTVSLARQGQANIPATNIQIDSLGSSIQGTFNLQGKPTGAWDLIVSKADATSTTLSNAFTVTEGGQPDLRIQKLGSPAVPGRNMTYFITVSNGGDVDSGALPIVESLEPWFTFISSNPPTNSVRQAPRIFPPGKPASTYDAFLEWDLPALGADGSKTISYTVAVDPTFPIGHTVRGPACIEVVGNSCEILEVACYSAVATTCVLQPETCPLIEESVLTCELGHGACLAAAGAICISHETPTVGSSDPNDLIGPSGGGPQRWTSGTQPLSYVILFENLPGATKAATDVTITDTFDKTDLDLSTLRLGSISFGSTIYTPPSVALATDPFTADVDLRPAQNLLVRVNAAINLTTGLLSVNLISIDPLTGLPPTDVLAGFLPPGVGGSVAVTVMPNAQLPTGTTISDQASIVFDTNAAISTPQWSNAIDNINPTSHVSFLAATQAASSFLVQWTGNDVGGGVSTFDIYVSDNGGPFSPWLTQTAVTSATYSGQPTHQYGFYSLARDLAGNVENSKSVAEATTTISGAAPLTVTTVSLAGGVIGTPYSQMLAAVGGTPPYVWAISGGRLPIGLTLNPFTGQVTGTPTNPVSSFVTFRVTDSGLPVQTASMNLTFTILSNTLTITTTSLPTGQVGVAYSETVATTGGTQPFKWELTGGSALPAGLTLNASTGVISGTPTAPVTNYRLLLRVTDSSTPTPQTAATSFTLTIIP